MLMGNRCRRCCCCCCMVRIQCPVAIACYRDKVKIVSTSSVCFFVFIGGVGCSLLFVLGGFSVLKVLIILLLLGVHYLVCRYVLSNEGIISKLMDDKLPKKYSEYE